MSTPRELVELYATLGERIASHTSTEDALAAVTAVAVDVIGAADFASITRDRGDHFQTVAPTEEAAAAADQLQYELGGGPCVEAAASGSMFVIDDVTTDPRWPAFGLRAATEVGVSSMLAIGMVIDNDIRAGLNLYSRKPVPFDQSAETLAMLLATHGAMAVSRVVERERAVNLEKALANSRQIGTAIGILMASHKVTSDHAFALLRIASQTLNRRLSAVAEDVIESGELTPPD